MARMTAAQADYKKSQGRELFSKGFTISNIAGIIGVGEKTLGKWRKDDNWDEEKELASLKPSNIRRLTLKMALAVQNNEELPYKADDVSKIVAAFDRITDAKKTALYSMESLDSFSNWMLQRAGSNTGKKRENLLELIKAVRPFFDEYITELLQDD